MYYICMIRIFPVSYTHLDVYKRQSVYRYIIKNKGLYSVYAILLVVSSTMSVFFAFVLSEIMNCAAEGNLQRLMRVLIVGIVFLLVTVFSEFFYGITKNKLICKMCIRDRYNIVQDYSEQW